MTADPKGDSTIACDAIWGQLMAECDQEPRDYCNNALADYDAVLSGRFRRPRLLRESDVEPVTLSDSALQVSLLGE